MAPPALLPGNNFISSHAVALVTASCRVALELTLKMLPDSGRFSLLWFHGTHHMQLYHTCFWGTEPEWQWKEKMVHFAMYIHLYTFSLCKMVKWPSIFNRPTSRKISLPLAPVVSITFNYSSWSCIPSFVFIPIDANIIDGSSPLGSDYHVPSCIPEKFKRNNFYTVQPPSQSK